MFLVVGLLCSTAVLASSQQIFVTQPGQNVPNRNLQQFGNTNFGSRSQALNNQRLNGNFIPTRRFNNVGTQGFAPSNQILNGGQARGQLPVAGVGVQRAPSPGGQIVDVPGILANIPPDVLRDTTSQLSQALIGRLTRPSGLGSLLMQSGGIRGIVEVFRSNNNNEPEPAQQSPQSQFLQQQQQLLALQQQQQVLAQLQQQFLLQQRLLALQRGQLSITQPVTQSIIQPVTQPIIQPVTQPIIQPVRLIQQPQTVNSSPIQQSGLRELVGSLLPF